MNQIINSLLPAAILAGLVWVSLRFTKSIGAATRYVIWWMVLIAVVALPFLPRPTHHSTAGAPSHPIPATTEHYRHLNPPKLDDDAILAIEQPRSSRLPQLVFIAWALMFSWRCMQIAQGYLYIRRIKRTATSWARSLPGHPRDVRLLRSHVISSPFAAGFLHPVIVVPSTLADQLTEAEMDHVLLHEAAHIARWDDWANLIGRACGAVLALHPVAMWILERIDREREMACDDWVVARTGAAPFYAESLARVCELSRRPMRAALASGVLGRSSRIRERIETLLASDRVFASRIARSSLVASSAILVALTASSVPASRWIAFAQRPEFEVASVRENKLEDGRIDPVPQRSGDLVIMHNTWLHSLIFYAYHLQAQFQLSAKEEGSIWEGKYDVEAKAQAGATEEQIQLMMQAMLEDRFKLKVHRETRELPAYHLSVAKSGPKLLAAGSNFTSRQVDGKDIPVVPGRCLPALGRDGAHLVCRGGTMLVLANILKNQLGGPVVDDTGLTGTYDFELIYERPNRRADKPAPDDVIPAPQISEAIRDLGLRLEKRKAPVEVLVVDHAEKPTAN